MEVVDQVSTVLGGVGGVAGTAYVVKHWNDPPANAGPTPPAPQTAEPPESSGSEPTP